MRMRELTKLNKQFRDMNKQYRNDLMWIIYDSGLIGLTLCWMSWSLYLITKILLIK